MVVLCSRPAQRVLAFVFFVSLGMSSALAGEGTIPACVQKASGQLRVVSPTEACHQSETRISLQTAGAEARPPVIWSGFCGYHGQGSSWRESWIRFCTDRVDFNTAADYLTATPEGVFTINRDGYYRIAFFAASGGRNPYVQLVKNGAAFQLGKLEIPWSMYAYQGNDLFSHAVWPFAAGDTLEVQVRAVAGQYAYFASIDGFPFNRLQIEYAGPLQ